MTLNTLHNQKALQKPLPTKAAVMASSALSILEMERMQTIYFTYFLLIMGLSYLVVLWSNKLEWIEPISTAETVVKL